MGTIPTVKALFPVGKTQWSKWNDEQRTAFNEARAAGVPFPDAVEAVNDMKPKKGNFITDIFHVVEDVVEAATQVEAIVDVAAPVVKAVVKRTRSKKGK
jgi:hypothetical protein